MQRRNTRTMSMMLKHNSNKANKNLAEELSNLDIIDENKNE